MSAHAHSNTKLPTDLYTAAQTRELDRRAIHERHIAGYALMSRAGEAAFRVLRERWPAAKIIVAVCGGGNNGGDGYVVARLACAAGLTARVSFLKDPEKLTGDACTAQADARAAGVSMEAFEPGALSDADVLVDAVFGTGLEREVAGRWKEAIDKMNRCDAPRLAIDIPSGLHADRGAILGAAVQAEATVTFIALKQGLFTGAGPALCGAVTFADLAVPEAVHAGIEPASRRYVGSNLERILPARSRTSHKGANGHVLVIGGDLGMAGAARMAAEAAGRCGAGLVSVATRAAHAPLQAAARPEVMFHGVESAAELAPLLNRATVVAVGPGLGRDHWGKSMLTAALACTKPSVVDADGLNLLAVNPRQCENSVLTPHPGEAARLLGTTIASVQSDRFSAVRELANRFRAICVLKGAGSLVVDEVGSVTVSTTGNPGMASGGMGDVLTGIVAGLLAQGLTLTDAARCGVHIHGRAGDLAAEQGERGLMATDLMAHLRTLVNPGLR